MKHVEPISYLQSLVYSISACRRCFGDKDNRARKFHQQMEQSQNYLNQEMDLQKFIFRQRVQTSAILALLKGRQSEFVDKMSELVLQESTESDHIAESSDDELNIITHEISNQNLKLMSTSGNKTDKRLLDQYLIREAHKKGIKMDFKVSES